VYECRAARKFFILAGDGNIATTFNDAGMMREIRQRGVSD
jgi:hypothetical protein